MARRVIVTSGAVAPTGSSSSAGMATIHGDPPQWSDDLDTTYARLTTYTDASGGFSGRNSVLVLMESGTYATPLAVSVDVRLAAEDVDTPWPTIEVRRVVGGEVCLTSSGDPGGAVPMTPTWVTFSMSEVGGGVANLLTWLAANEAELQVRSGYLFTGPTAEAQYRHLKVYEVAMVLEGLPGDAPPCRLFPRADGLGVGSGRHYPPPKSQQRSARRFGYY